MGVAVSPPSVFALLDGNNFYVSCERIFNQKLSRRPVVVLWAVGWILCGSGCV